MSDSNSSRVWSNFTLIVSLTIALLMYVLAFFFAITSLDTIESSSIAPDFLGELYGIEGFNLGLTITMIAVLSIGFFFSVIAWATFVELSNKIPGWKEIFFPLLLNMVYILFLVNLTVGSIGSDGGTNFTSGMKYGVFLLTLVMNALLIAYIANTSSTDE